MIVARGFNGTALLRVSCFMEAVDEQRARAAPLRMTDAVAAKVGELIAKEDNSDLMLRVFFSGGSCAGFQYGFTFDESREDGDTAIENAGVVPSVDPMSVQYLMGAEIDYQEDPQGSQFIIHDPHAVTTCGCGYSFSV